MHAHARAHHFKSIANLNWALYDKEQISVSILNLAPPSFASPLIQS